MKTINVAILFSGNGSNLENIYKKMQNLVVVCESCGNSSLDKHSADLLDSTHPLAPSAREGESDLSLQGTRSEANATKQATNQILVCHDFATSAKSHNDKNANDLRGSILDEKSGLRSYEQGNRTWRPLTKRIASLPDLSPKDNALQLNFPLAISSKDSAFGITRCANLGLKCEVIDYKTNKGDFFEKIIATLESHKIDLVILAGFMKILPPTFNAKFHALNIHPSILPLFKGANAIVESYQSDMKIAGVSVHFVNDELDSGALIAQDVIHKIEGESLESFEARIHALEYEIYPKAIEKAVQILARESTIKARDLAESKIDSRKSNHKSTQDSQDLHESKSK